MRDETPIALKARWVFPVSAPPIPGGVLTLSGSSIATVGREDALAKPIDLGNVAIVPGLVNAHTHLEFSQLAAPLGSPGMSLPDWIRYVVSQRRSTADAGQSAIRQGLAECLATGTTCVGEIATTDWRSFEPPAALPATVMFREAIAPRGDRAEAAACAADDFLSAATTDPRVCLGLSPHAPYTVHPRLLDSMVELTRKFQVPLAMHLAESPEELELLAGNRGPFVELLKDFGSWDADPAARYPRILNYLERLARAPRALVIHGNYLNAAELDYLAQRSATMVVIYCPRTHDFFRHVTYPLAKMLTAGVSVALGTDSRASNPDLSLWEEIRFVARHHPRVSPTTVLELGTLAGARALGLADRIGTLEAGKDADLAIIALGESNEADPHEALFADTARVTDTWLRGRPLSAMRS